MAVGERVNPWVEHVRRFARENNMTYGCALSDARIKDGYVKSVRRSASKKPTVTGREAYASMPTMERYVNARAVEATPAPKTRVMVPERAPPVLLRKDGTPVMSKEVRALRKARREQIKKREENLPWHMRGNWQ